MIIVQAALLSGIDSSMSSLGRLEITNDGTGTASKGNYIVVLYSRGANGRKIRTAKIKNWPRNAKTAWALVTAAIEAVKPKKKG